MTFEEMYEKYMKDSSVNYEQARFIWNCAIDKAMQCDGIDDNAPISWLKVPIETPNYFG